MPATTVLRSGVASLATLASRDLSTLWRSVSTADEAKAALLDVLPKLVRTYGAAAATLSADWYDDLRDEKSVRGNFRAIPVKIGDAGADALAGFGVSPLYRASPDWDAARVLIAGGLQRRIANASRETVMGSAMADPRARGWTRVGDGGCTFCQMLIGRGAVYTEASADFESHDHCGCAAVPAF